MQKLLVPSHGFAVLVVCSLGLPKAALRCSCSQPAMRLKTKHCRTNIRLHTISNLSGPVFVWPKHKMGFYIDRPGCKMEFLFFLFFCDEVNISNYV